MMMMETRQKEIESALIEAYTEDFEERMSDIVQNICFGCIVSHPSQKNHDVCLMMSEEDRVDACWREFLRTVRHDLVTEAWIDRLPGDVDYDEMKGLMNYEYRVKYWLSKREDAIKQNLLRRYEHRRGRMEEEEEESTESKPGDEKTILRCSKTNERILHDIDTERCSELSSNTNETEPV